MNAAGPGIAAVDRLLPWDEGCGVGVGDRLPVMNEVHAKVIFRDTKGVVPRDAPMLIWSDPQIINYDDEMREAMVRVVVVGGWAVGGGWEVGGRAVGGWWVVGV